MKITIDIPTANESQVEAAFARYHPKQTLEEAIMGHIIQTTRNHEEKTRRESATTDSEQAVQTLKETMTAQREAHEKV